MNYIKYKLDLIYKQSKASVLEMTTWIAFLSSIVTTLFVVYNVGFEITASQRLLFPTVFKVMTILFLLVNILRVSYDYKALIKKKAKIEWINIFILSATYLYVYIPGLFESASHVKFIYLYWAVISVLFFVSITEISRDVLLVLSKTVNPLSIFVVSFLLLISFGTLFLMLPNSTYNGISFVDALFTATSAVCVTGLTSVDFASTFTFSGQIIVMFLIQIGGLGVITITSFFAVFFLEGVSIKSEYLIKDIVSGDQSNNLGGLLTRIIIITFGIEIIGAIAIYYYTSPYLLMDQGDKVFFAMFHAVSAFCNAGFSTLPLNLADPSVINISQLYLIISFLIIFGGIGFPIFSNILIVFGHRVMQVFDKLRGRVAFRHVRDWDMNSIIVLKTTAFLLISGTSYFLIFEWDGLLNKFEGGDKFVQAFFNAVTPRTAGFNSIDYGSLSIITLYVIMFLMWVGGSPQSTAGGIKVTTFALMFRNAAQLVKGKEKVELHGREISSLSITRAFATVVLSLFFIASAHIALLAIEPSIEPIKLLFEVFSAIGTVGLTMGITSDLLPESKIIITTLMFIGRIGVASILASLFKRRNDLRYRYPQADILIN